MGFDSSPIRLAGFQSPYERSLICGEGWVFEQIHGGAVPYIRPEVIEEEDR